MTVMMIRRLLPPSLLRHHLAWWCRHPTTIRLRSTTSWHSCFASSSFFSSYSLASSTAQKKETNLPPKVVYDVIIIGGGPTGLFLSSLLSKYDISSQLVFDKRPIAEVIKHPQAHYINIRSMEILKAELPIVYSKVVNRSSSRNTTSGWVQMQGCITFHCCES
jgi:hypothetical protein